MTITDAMKTYRLPLHTTLEQLETQFYADRATFLVFGDKVLMAGYYYGGQYANCYYGAVYKPVTDDLPGECEIVLTAVSGERFADNGHAILWAMQQN